ncbi:hypothetical protein E2542_SST04433 [Spatholobus suberectus]|nr:hypothetical protein E2542_SST04433 [Spatholobus suberectus]
MELGLSLGDAARPFRLMEKPREGSNQLGLGFNTGTTLLSIGPLVTKQIDQHQQQEETPNQKHNKHNTHNHSTTEEDHEDFTNESLISPSFKDINNTVVQLDLLPHTPAVSPVNQPSNFLLDPLSQNAGRSTRGWDMNTTAAAVAMMMEEEVVPSPSSNSTAAWFQMDLCIFSKGRSVSGEDYDERQRRGSDEDENGVVVVAVAALGRSSGSLRNNLLSWKRVSKSTTLLTLNKSLLLPNNCIFALAK